jgi:hypothetical protein
MISQIFPVVLFTYNRIKHTKKVVETLLQNSLSSETDLIIYSDGPKKFTDFYKIFILRRYLSGITGFKSVTINKRFKNIGLASSIIHGVSEILSKYEAAIILEDDVVCSANFLIYMNYYLNTLRSNEKVMHISAYMFPIEGVRHLDEIFFLRVTTCWGWGTWSRAWSKFIIDGEKILNRIKDSNLEFEFNIENSLDYIQMLKDQIAGKNDSWAVRWYGSVFLNKGMCLHPAVSYVDNIGNDGSGKHSSVTNYYKVDNLNKLNCFKNITEISESRKALDSLIVFNKNLKIDKLNFIFRVFKKIWKMI